ncbi:hypothetical protein C3747_171g115 [Trypanosoma cruzi]|uniref:Uncharacterized protein n=1 Tax=Trypanosoma cruzi TaxID=5693 RepID=A0A2V2W4V0_TRYCR|nr:hypothetical protein C3747_171g115 [Trypanosoma cruzi]
MERHLKFLRESSDGRVEGGIVIVVPPEEGGLEKRDEQKTRSASSYRRQLHSQPSNVNDSTTGRHSAGSNNSQMLIFRGSGSCVDRGPSEVLCEEYEETSVDEEGASLSNLELSFHSNSVISASSIAHLGDAVPDDSLVDADAEGTAIRRGSAAASPTDSGECGVSCWRHHLHSCKCQPIIPQNSLLSWSRRWRSARHCARRLPRHRNG